MKTGKCVSYSGWKHWSGDHTCPKCGGTDIEYDAGMVLTSYPPQAQLRCKSCKHQFNSGFQAEWTDNDSLSKQWQHDQSILGIPQVGDLPPAPALSSPNYGWICPKCGRVLAPHVNSCPYCSESTTINITY